MTRAGAKVHRGNEGVLRPSGERKLYDCQTSSWHHLPSCRAYVSASVRKLDVFEQHHTSDRTLDMVFPLAKLQIVSTISTVYHRLNFTTDRFCLSFLFAILFPAILVLSSMSTCKTMNYEPAPYPNPLNQAPLSQAPHSQTKLHDALTRFALGPCLYEFCLQILVFQLAVGKYVTRFKIPAFLASLVPANSSASCHHPRSRSMLVSAAAISPDIFTKKVVCVCVSLRS